MFVLIVGSAVLYMMTACLAAACVMAEREKRTQWSAVIPGRKFVIPKWEKVLGWYSTPVLFYGLFMDRKINKALGRNS